MMNHKTPKGGLRVSIDPNLTVRTMTDDQQKAYRRYGWLLDIGYYPAEAWNKLLAAFDESTLTPEFHAHLVPS